MNRKSKKSIALAILFLLVVAAGIGYYLFNKGPLNVKDSDARDIEAVKLYAAYSSDSAAAEKSYTNKIVAVSGNVQNVSINQQKQQVILLKGDAGGSAVNCTMEGTTAGIHPGAKVTIKGICSGIGEGDVDLGITGDVYLTRCYLVK